MDSATKMEMGDGSLTGEVKQDNAELRRLFTRLYSLAENPTVEAGQWRSFVELLVQLRDQLAMHFALEEANGYFDEAVTLAPQVVNDAERLRSEHADLYRDMCELTDRAERMIAHRSIGHAMRDVAARFHAFAVRFEDHESREKSLVLATFDDDIGVGD